ncbi:hypothetical protein DYB35_004854 [Aphanomyces astaci]|uniref:Uncharacterized protein n=1 Tax=Aphanomyces astaci TaxID=112090 RepID=A0A418D504_APHAT|nr:hypothetical protein DYB35_004854 [Aphanomyces astaci]
MCVDDVLAKISEQAARLLTDLVAFVDMHCGNVAHLYRTDGNSSEVEELYLAFHRHLTTSSATFVNLHVFSPHAITQKVARKLIRGADTWQYTEAATIPSALHSADKPLQYAVKVTWRPQDGVLYDEDRLRAQLGAYGTVNSMALHPTEPKARVSMYWNKGSQLDKVVVKLQTKASLHVLRLQVIPALNAMEDADDDDDSSKHVLRTTTMAAADDMSSETIRSMHQAQVLVLRMLEGSVADQSRPEDTSLVLEYQRAMEAHFRSKMTACRVVALEADKQSADLREDLRACRSDLACHLAMLSHLKR